jgi:transposase
MATTDACPFWTELLHLKGYHVVYVLRGTPTDPVRLTLVPDFPLGLCPHCQRASDLIHRRLASDPLKDLPLGPQAVELVVRRYQFACRHCGHFFTPAAPAFAPSAHATERFLEQAARLIRCSDVANAATLLGVPEKTLEKWYYDYAERQRQQLPAGKPIQQIGIDELHIKKKDRPYAAVIIDHTNQRVLEVLESREKHVVIDYLRRAKAQGVLAQVVEVTTDMWDSYVEAARTVFGPAVRVTIDRFHVMKNFQERLTAARREIQRSLPKAEAKALKGTRWLWLTNEENLSPTERAQLAVLCQRFLVLGALRQQRERLRALFEDRTIHTAASGVQRLRAWMREARSLGLQALEMFCQTQPFQHRRVGHIMMVGNGLLSYSGVRDDPSTKAIEASETHAVGQTARGASVRRDSLGHCATWPGGAIGSDGAWHLGADARRSHVGKALPGTCARAVYT